MSRVEKIKTRAKKLYFTYNTVITSVLTFLQANLDIIKDMNKLYFLFIGLIVFAGNAFILITTKKRVKKAQKDDIDDPIPD